MSKSVAVKGDTQFETSTKKLTADTNQSGSWQPGKLKVTPGEKITVADKGVELHAVMHWTYVGGMAGPNAVPPVFETVILTANPTKLKDKGKNVLVEGDKAEGSVDSGNKIFVGSSQNILKTD